MESNLEAFKLCTTNKAYMLKWAEDIMKTTFPSPPSSQVEKFVQEVCRGNIKQSINIIFDNAESEIEKIFLNSLLLHASNRHPLFFSFTQPLSDTSQHIEVLRKKYKLVEEMLDVFKTEDDESGVENFIQFVFSNDEAEETKLSVISFVLSYFTLNYYKHYHVSIQSTFLDIEQNGKHIRPDIFIWLPSVPSFKLVVECDGYDYHSDKDSFSNDRARDRLLQTRGFQVHRFSGHEIVNSPIIKSEELYEYLAKIYQQLR